MKPPTAEQLAESVEAESIEQNLRGALRRVQIQLREEKDRKGAMLEAAYQGAFDANLSLGKIQPVKPPTFKASKGRAETELWHITDLQGGKKTTTYNLDVMAHRVHQVVDKGIKLADIQRSDHQVEDLVILFGGDMIEGLFNFPRQVFETDSTIFGQWSAVSRLLVDITRRALGSFKTVTVVPEWGNHGRIGSKRDAIPLSDNIDRMCYHFAKTILAVTDPDPRLKWQDCPENIQHVEIGNYRALSIHGDEIGRNGFASPPAIARWANDMRSGACAFPFRDVYVGHYHTNMEVSMANGVGTVFFTGSTESGSLYAMESMARGSVPTQRCHFIDPEKGRVTSRYTIWLE